MNSYSKHFTLRAHLVGQDVFLAQVVCSLITFLPFLPVLILTLFTLLLT